MKIIGVIAEYNPFHLGHQYQINKIKELYPDSLIITIITTCFTERGDISILNKYNKTKICLDNNIDLVIELPTIYSIQSADTFAKGALEILNDLKIDTLIFGSESNDIETLTKIANYQINDNNCNILTQKYIAEGYNYPTSLSKAIEDKLHIKITNPNDLLGISYIKEIIKRNYKITPISIKRTNNYHSKTATNNIISANLIREKYQNKEDISKYIPKNTNKLYYNNISLETVYPYLKYQLIINKNNLSNYLTVDEGIENRILKYIDKSNTWSTLINNIKTKRYTYNKINRTLIHILLGIKKEDINNKNYIRLLGFNQKGKKYLNSIKKDLKLDLYTGYKPNKNTNLDIEYKTTKIYSLIVNDPSIIDIELQNKPIIK